MTANDRLRQNLRELMEWRRLTQAELAEALGVSQPWVSKRLSGVTPFQIEDLDRLARLFDLTVAQLLQDGYGQWERRSGEDRRVSLERRRARRPTDPPARPDDDDPPPLGSTRRFQR